MFAQTFWRARRYKRRAILPSGGIRAQSRLWGRFLRRVTRQNRLVVNFFGMPFRARTLACSRRRVRGADGLAIALDWMMFRGGALVRVLPRMSETTDRLPRLSCWGTHR